MAEALWLLLLPAKVPDKYSAHAGRAREALDAAWDGLLPEARADVSRLLQCHACGGPPLLRDLAAGHYALYRAAIGARGLAILLEGGGRSPPEKVRKAAPPAEHMWKAPPPAYEDCGPGWLARTRWELTGPA